jgi:hypothetical protein
VEPTNITRLTYRDGVLTNVKKGNMQTVLTYTGGVLTGITKSLAPSVTGAVGDFIIGDNFVIGG